MKFRILVVDDHKDTRKAMGLRLHKANYDTDFAESVESAVAAARSNCPDLIVLDLGLPDGDGFDVLSQLSENPATAHVPVIVISAREPVGYEKHIVESQTQGFFLKPINVAEFLDRIEWALDGSHREAA